MTYNIYFQYKWKIQMGKAKWGNPNGKTQMGSSMYADDSVL